MTLEGVTVHESLISTQEEADTKVVLHALDGPSSRTGNVYIDSPSGDSDIIVTAMGNITDKHRVQSGSGNGDKRKVLWLKNFPLSEDKCNALIGFHLFTRNDCISSFIQKKGDILEENARRRAIYSSIHKLCK